jgi:hypothetical protein
MSKFQSGLFALGGMLLYLLVFVGLFSLYYFLRDRLRLRRKQRRLEQLLQGRDLKAAIEDSPYIYGSAQGEDSLRITVKDKGPAPVAWATTELDAHIWILEQEAEQE